MGKVLQPSKNRRVEIPKGSGKTRRLGIPTIKDRVVQGALKLILEAIFEADFHTSSFVYRPNGQHPKRRIAWCMGWYKGSPESSMLILRATSTTCAIIGYFKSQPSEYKTPRF